jgi:glucosyl-dolichyl phosphate glucuronosyltransferase
MMDSGELSLGRADARARRATRARAARLAPALAPRENLYPPGVSIIICTYNRLPLLKKMIDSIRPQLPADYPLEVLIVDNNSSDGTADYVRGLRLQDETFQYVLETKQGLSHARNGGASAAKHDFLFYADDDAFLSPGFLRNMGEALGAHDPDMFGGPVFPDYVDPKPDWFPESLEIRRKAETSGVYTHVTLSGSSFGIRRSVLQRIGGFNPQFGMTGKRPGMLEERLAIEAYRRITPPAEQKVYYSVESFVYHYTPASRMRLGFQLRRIYQANFSYIKYCLEQGVRSPGLLCSQLAKRLGSEALRFIGNMPAVWGERKTRPDRLMSEIVRLNYRVADAHAGIEFLLTDGGRVKARLAQTTEDRPLQIAVLHSSKLDDGARPGAARLNLVLAHLATNAHVETRCVHGLNAKGMREMVDALSPRSLDLIITDNMKVVDACKNLRAHLPHLQILLWVREAGQAEFAQRPWLYWRNPGEWVNRVLRMRSAVRAADQVIWSATPNGRIARFLLGARSWALVGNSTNGGSELSETARKQWNGVVEAARIWAPRRLTP